MRLPLHIKKDIAESNQTTEETNSRHPKPPELK
jgi:hypothetical protein